MSCILLSTITYLPKLFSCVHVISSCIWGRQYVNYIVETHFTVPKTPITFYSILYINTNNTKNTKII